MADDPIELTNNHQSRRWEALVDGVVAGYVEYRTVDDRIIFIHTVVDPQLEGRGIGSRLARAALDDAVAKGQRITPRCPFIRAYLERHAEYAASIDQSQRGS